MSIVTWKKLIVKGGRVLNLSQVGGLDCTGVNSNVLDVVTLKCKEILKCLNACTASSTTDLYLTKSSSTYKASYFDPGIKILKTYFNGFINAKDYKLYVAYYAGGPSLACCPRDTGLKLRLKKKGNSKYIILEPAYNNPYSVGSVRKKLTEKGRCTTILHELTHGIMMTKDVETYGTAGYTHKSANMDNAVTTDSECKALALDGQVDTDFNVPLSYVNAENWTRAIWACHPVVEERTKDDRIVVI